MLSVATNPANNEETAESNNALAQSRSAGSSPRSPGGQARATMPAAIERQPSDTADGAVAVKSAASEPLHRHPM